MNLDRNSGSRDIDFRLTDMTTSAMPGGFVRAENCVGIDDIYITECARMYNA